jgi:4-amino-4-deoxy-L-arabinose transferase-like glycosyltransferase
VIETDQKRQFKELLPLGIIWLIAAICDRLWLALDHGVPAWDQTNHLTGSLNYLKALQNPQFFSTQWWQNFWMLSSKYPPLTYISTAPFQQIFGTSPDFATLVNLLFTAILIATVYALGKHLFSAKAGFWAVVTCLLLPRLYLIRLDYLLDYPLTALVTASFYCLTVWRDTKKPLQGWRWALSFGVCFGLAIMTKQSVLWFLFVPLLWLFVTNLFRLNWKQVFQLSGGFLLSIVIFGSWYRTNWIFFLSAEQRGIVESAIIEGDPPLSTLAAWTHYWYDLPDAVSFPLLVVPLVGFLLSLILGFKKTSLVKIKDNRNTASNLSWLAFYLISSYFICSAIVNKNPRYIMPYLPILSVVLGYGFSLFPKKLRLVPWLTVGFAFILMCLNLFPIGGIAGTYLTKTFSPKAQNYPYLGKVWQHEQVIEEIIRTEPYLQTTLGVLPRTAQINNHNVNYYGALRNFQVYGREAGTRKKFLEQDQRSLSWFITKTGNQGAPKEAQVLMVQSVENNPDFQVKKTWDLPDNSVLKLYHRIQPTLQVKPIPQALTQVKLEQVIVPQQAPAGTPVQVRYQWSGSWEQLRSGIVLLTWQQNKQRWLHDHAIAFGKLHPGNLKPNQLSGSFQITEQTAMLPPAAIEAGDYTLQATYLNRETGDNYPISVPPVTLKIAPNTPATPAPELDLVTQLRTLAISLPKGRSALEQIFDEIGRINQYDPVQDYTIAAQRALEYRLQQEPQNREFAYALAFSNILRRDADQAITALKQVVQLDAQNPYAYAYLAFVYLYQWRGKAAQEALEPALALNGKIPELKALLGVAALLQGNIFKAWDLWQGVKL